MGVYFIKLEWMWYVQLPVTKKGHKHAVVFMDYVTDNVPEVFPKTTLHQP